MSLGGVSAPAKVDRLQQHWESWSAEQQARIAVRCADHFIRNVLPSVVEQQALTDAAGTIRALPEISDAGSLVRAEPLLSSLIRRGGPLTFDEVSMDLMASVFTVLGFLNGTFNLYEACFMTVMVSRLAFGDDRLVPMMEKDLVGPEL